MKKFLIAIAASLTSILSVHAATVSINVGSKSIRIPIPNGYVSAKEEAPQLFEFQEHLTARQNKLLALFVNKEELSHWRASHQPSFKSFYAIQVSKQLLNVNFTPYMLASIKADVKHSVSDVEQYLTKKDGEAAVNGNHFVKNKGANATFTAGRPKIIGIFKDDDKTFGFLQLLKVTSVVNHTNVSEISAMSNIAALFKNRLIGFIVYHPFTGNQDIDWLKAASLKWVADTRKINQ